MKWYEGLTVFLVKNYDNIRFAGFFIASLAVFIYSARMLFLSIKHKEHKNSVLSPVQWCTLGVFVSVLLMHLPIFYITFDFGDKLTVFRPFLISFLYSLRYFVIDAEYIDLILGETQTLSGVIRIPFSLFAAILCLVAPVLTLTNLLSLFKNLRDSVRYALVKNQPIYIMSELNRRSIALAIDIYDSKREENPVIVFTDVFAQNEEEDYELMCEVRRINAICLKTDITELDILSKKPNIEIFLIGENESENVSQGIKLVTELDKANKKHNIKVFIFNRHESGEYIVNSVKYDNLLKFAKEHEYDNSSFKLRIVNEIRQLAWNTVPQIGVFDIAQKNRKTISVLIAGMGEYGIEFFKTLIWFCQFEGYTPKFTLIDKISKKSDGSGGVEAIINRHCPELLSTCKSNEYGEAYYDIEVISGVDFTSNDLDEMVLYSGTDTKKRRLAERLRGVNLAIVALGDDDINIETSVHIRELYDRACKHYVNASVKPNEEQLRIYSVVYDNHKSDILCGDRDSDEQFLINHANIPYNIDFIGNMSSQFSYNNIYDMELENAALINHHISWVAKEKKKLIDQNKEKYERFDYFRLSSMASELYDREIDKNEQLKKLTECTNENGKCKSAKDEKGKCEACKLKARSEHMRWNAYTRSIGYCYQDGVRNDRARIHSDLVDWITLHPEDKMKDFN